ncbi:HDIG domain-containing metalloprotein [Geopsychrobacter electrodiphilus]|uniref:HDIG domain-containing metalloprotein n=1 Tax=Geopsychrobacter electrodiphilus TaxID=225196 RepID=UPI000360EB99|nr:HDIG domain-containing metalloprotein [Geopsychrobacter electrodiphilus]
MEYGIERATALSLVHEHLQQPNMIKHCLASEAVMRALARQLHEDEEQWGLAGLLHDLDAEATADNLSIHTHQTVRILEERGVDPAIIDAIAMHNAEAHNTQRRTTFHHALAAGETITGLITATALVYPDKKLASVKPKSVTKRIKEKAFAAGANRDIIRECELIGIPLPDFCALCLGAMQEISEDLGL